MGESLKTYGTLLKNMQVIRVPWWHSSERFDLVTAVARVPFLAQELLHMGWGWGAKKKCKMSVLLEDPIREGEQKMIWFPCPVPPLLTFDIIIHLVTKCGI